MVIHKRVGKLMQKINLKHSVIFFNFWALIFLVYYFSFFCHLYFIKYMFLI